MKLIKSVNNFFVSQKCTVWSNPKVGIDQKVVEKKLCYVTLPLLCDYCAVQSIEKRLLYFEFMARWFMAQAR